MTHPFFHPVPMALSHRGDAQNFPENTLEAFRAAAELGTHCIESDVQMSADGHAVLIHDETLERTTDGSGRVDKHTLKQLKMLDGGYKFSPDGKESFPFRDQGITIPCLEEALEAFPDMRFCLDLKPKSAVLVREFCSVISRMDALDRILCSSAHDSNLRLLRELLPDAASGCGTSEALGVLMLAQPGMLFLRKSMPGQVLQVPPTLGPLPLLTSRMVQQFHQAGLYAHTWAINRRDHMEELLEAGVDGIVTDETALLLEVIREYSES